MSENQTSSFLLKIIEVHERCWGTLKYENRPGLQDILNAHIVAVWYPIRRQNQSCFTITLHADIGEIETYLTKVFIAYNTQPPQRRLRSLFIDKKQVKIVGISLILDE